MCCYFSLSPLQVSAYFLRGKSRTDGKSKGMNSAKVPTTQRLSCRMSDQDHTVDERMADGVDPQLNVVRTIKAVMKSARLLAYMRPETQNTGVILDCPNRMTGPVSW